MKTMLGIVWVLSVLAVGASADVLVVGPNRAAVLPGDTSGLTQVAVQFDLSGMRTGEGRAIDEAKLEWTPSGVPSGEHLEFSAYAATEAWSGASTSVQAAATATGEWDIDPADYAINGGFVRLDVKELVTAWEAGSAENHGLVLVMGELNREALDAGLGQIRLVIHYGFRR